MNSFKQLASTLLFVCSLFIIPALATDPELCDKYGDVAPIPSLDGKGFCRSANIEAANTGKCILLGVIGKAFTSDLGNSIARHACRAAQQVPILTKTAAGTDINPTLPDARPLPNAFDSSSTLAAEGSTYHYWWTALYNFGIVASCAATEAPHTLTSGPLQLPDPDAVWQVPPGWSVHSVVWSNANMDSGREGLYLPLAAILLSKDSLGILIRGTESFSDWQTDFTYSQVAFSGPISWPGRTHQGFSRLAAYLWATGVQAAVDSLVLQEGSSVKSVVLSGHSMGAGVGTLLSYTLQTYLTTKGSKVRLDAMLFAPPNVGDTTFTAAYGQVVNGRRIPFVADLVPQLPCAPTVTACARGPWQGAPMVAVGVWAYDTIPGTVLLTAEGMPMEQDAWATLGPMYACQLGRYVLATHVCAYQCYLSQYVEGGSGSNMCRLWRGDAAAGVAGGQPEGTFCPGFPVAGGTQYPYKASNIMSLLS